MKQSMTEQDIINIVNMPATTSSARLAVTGCILLSSACTSLIDYTVAHGETFSIDKRMLKITNFESSLVWNKLGNKAVEIGVKLQLIWLGITDAEATFKNNFYSSLQTLILSKGKGHPVIVASKSKLPEETKLALSMWLLVGSVIHRGRSIEELFAEAGENVFDDITLRPLAMEREAWTELVLDSLEDEEDRIATGVIEAAWLEERKAKE